MVIVILKNSSLQQNGSATPKKSAGKQNGSGTLKKLAGKQNGSATPKKAARKQNGSATPKKAAGKQNGSATPKKAARKQNGSATPKKSSGKQNGSATPKKSTGKQNGSATPKKSSGKQNGRAFYDPMAVTWMERHNETMNKLWGKLPSFVGPTLATLAVFTLGATLRGEWLLVLVHYTKHIGVSNPWASSNATFNWNDVTLDSLKLTNVSYFMISATLVSYAMYFIIGGFLHWYFYLRQRDNASEWKCQPEKWLSPELERHEIITGSFALLITSSFTGLLACYISNGGWSTVYYSYDEYSWWWFFLQWPVIFIYQDYITYWIHRAYHTPFLYKHFHKLHHKYKQPTAFSVTAIHPFEIMHVQIAMCLPLIAFPVHWVPFYTIALYTYYHGLIDHSGITFKAHWWQPWQPDAIFHDNHHQYFHVNFGFNIFLWDKIHGTYRRKDRIYSEEIFYGKGKGLNEATDTELREDISQRNSENPLAYRSNQNEFQISEQELSNTIKKAS